MLLGFTTNAANAFIKVTDEDEDVDVEVIQPIDPDAKDGTEKAQGKREVKREKRIVGISNYKITPTHVAKSRPSSSAAAPSKAVLEEIESSLGADRNTLFDTYEERMSAMQIFLDFHTTFDSFVSEACVNCFMVVVHPSYHGRGVGEMLVGWGIRVADSLMLPAWTMCVENGEGVFKAGGYEVVEGGRVELKQDGFRCGFVVMRRGAKVGQMEGRELRRVA